VWGLSSRLPDRAIVTSDSGSCPNWYARDQHTARHDVLAVGRTGVDGRGRASRDRREFAHPHRPVIALVGDGAMQMNNMAELITVAEYWKRWGDPRWICCVFNNEDLTQVTWEQRVLAGDPKFEASQNVPFVQYSNFAELIGLKSIFVDDPERLGPAWEEALASDRPVVLDVNTDPNLPPLPSHVSTEQAVKFAKSLIKGDPDERSVLLNTAKELWGTIFPGRKT
jgi:pyruvate dehydrogenase (quinone)